MCVFVYNASMKNAIMPSPHIPTPENALTERANICMEQDIYDTQVDIHLALMSGNQENSTLAHQRLEKLKKIRDMPRHLFIGEYNEKFNTVDNIGLNIGLDTTQIDVLIQYYEKKYNTIDTLQVDNEVSDAACRILSTQINQNFSLTLDQICEMLHILKSTYEGQSDAPIPLYKKCNKELDIY